MDSEAKERVKQEIHGIYHLWKEALPTGEFRDLVAAYTEDCRLNQPNGPTLHGREAMHTVLKSLWKAGARSIDLCLEELGGTEDNPWKRGTNTIFTEDGSSMGSGKDICIYKRVDGKLYVDIDMWSSST